MLNKKIIGLITLVLISVSISGCSLVKKEKSGYEEAVDKITQINYEERQEQLNQIVADGMMNVQYSPHASFKGTTSVSFNVKNIENNKHPIVFAIYDENDNIIYKSKKIELGYELSSIELDKEISKGTHDCKIKIGYDGEGNVASVFPITVEVR